MERELPKAEGKARTKATGENSLERAEVCPRGPEALTGSEEREVV